MKNVIGVLAMCAALGVHAEDAQITKSAREAKFLSCLATVAELEKFFGEGHSYGNWSSWATERPSTQPFNTSIELTFDDGDQLVDLTIAPTPDGQCSYVYTRTWYSAKSCIATSKEKFLEGFEYKTELNKDIAAFSKNGVKVLLMPAGNGCVVQKKEIGFRNNKQNAQP